MPSSGSTTAKVQRTVLIVDDSVDDIYSTKRLLKKSRSSDYKIDAVETYESAMNKMIQNTHDVYLVDIFLGADSGIDLIREAKVKGFRGPAIVLTGSEDNDDDQRALEEGAVDFLPKSKLDSELLDRSIRYGIGRVESERLIVNNQLQLSHAIRMATVGEIASGIAHEINNPLSIVLGRAEILGGMLKKVDTQPELKSAMNAAIEKIADTSLRIASVVKTLLNVARKSSERDIELTPIESIIEEALTIYRLQPTDQIIHVEVGGDLDAKIECVAAEVAHVVLNLVKNARDEQLRKKDPWIKIGIQELKDTVKISITDSGPPIDDSAAKKILDGSGTTKKSGKGTGIGLSLSRLLLERHAGRLSIDTQADHAKFDVVLPKLQSRSRPRRTILIVDDEKTIAEFLREYLKDAFDVYLSNNGASALETLESKKIDIVLTDYKMPGLSGVEVYEKTKERMGDSTPPFYIVSGEHNPELPDGVTFIQKPFDPSKILALLQSESDQHFDARNEAD